MSGLLDAIRSATVIDLAQPYFPGMPHFPTHPPFLFGLTKKHGDLVTEGGVSSSADALALGSHVGTHIDALCHFSCGGKLYGGIDVMSMQSDASGIQRYSVDTIAPIMRRGVLLDIPAVRGVRWLEPGDCVTAADLAAAQEAQQVSVGPGDLLFVRVGHRRRRAELGPWDVAGSRAGLHPQAMEYLADRQVAALGSDGNSDTAPSLVDGVAFPVHVLAINAMGLHLVDYLQLDDLLQVCQSAARWSFLCVIAPLRLPGGTGSPVNPIAIL